MKQIIIFFILLTGFIYSQPIDTTGTGGSGLNQSQVEAIVADSVYALETRLNEALANEQLSDLGTTAINVHLKPAITDVYILGDYNKQWLGLFSKYWYWYGESGYYSRLVFADPTSTNKTITIPNETGTLALNTLSNLGTTSINVSLIPYQSSMTSVGSRLKYFSGVFQAYNALTYDGSYFTFLTTTPITDDRSIVFPNASGTVALTSDIAGYAPLANPTFTGIVALPVTTSVTFGGIALSASITQLNHLNTVSSNVQTQISARPTVATVASMISDSLATYNGSGDSSFELDGNLDIMPKVD